MSARRAAAAPHHRRQHAPSPHTTAHMTAHMTGTRSTKVTDRSRPPRPAGTWSIGGGECLSLNWWPPGSMPRRFNTCGLVTRRPCARQSQRFELPAAAAGQRETRERQSSAAEPRTSRQPPRCPFTPQMWADMWPARVVHGLAATHPGTSQPPSPADRDRKAT